MREASASEAVGGTDLTAAAGAGGVTLRRLLGWLAAARVEHNERRSLRLQPLVSCSPMLPEQLTHDERLVTGLSEDRMLVIGLVADWR